jgi:signal transduction histidine kinase
MASNDPAVIGILRSHKGRLRVRSAPGQGASSKFLLPGLAPVDEARARSN